MSKQAQTAPLDEAPNELYERDFYEWTRRTAKLLRSGCLDRANTAQAAEEIEDMGKRDAREVDSRMSTLILHLLKWQFQPERRSRSWRTTVLQQRQAIDRILQQSPSLRRRLGVRLELNYRNASKLAEVEAGLSSGRLPAKCPYAIEQILDETFLPG